MRVKAERTQAPRDNCNLLFPFRRAPGAGHIHQTHRFGYETGKKNPYFKSRTSACWQALYPPPPPPHHTSHRSLPGAMAAFVFVFHLWLPQIV